MKLVLDVNVLLSGSLWRGNPSLLVDAVLDGSATLCASAAVLAEFQKVILRDKFRKRLEESGRSALEMIARFQAAALIVGDSPIIVPSTLRDLSDIHVLACAASAGADAIVTGDDDLLSMKTFREIPILTVRQALEKLGIPAA